MPEEVNPLSVEGWLMRGAIREDDLPVLFGENPQDDPYGQIFRVFNHFYDPRNNRGLRVLGINIGAKAPDWGIGTDDVFADANDPDVWRRNHFTVFDAREAMFRALTGMKQDGSRAIGAGGAEPVTTADREAVRKAYWATTLRSLGDLLHTIQDMAQPQHTRNDPHAGRDYDPPAGVLGHASHYEAYIDARAKQAEIKNANGSTTFAKPLVYDTSPSYPIPAFNDYVSYFTSQHLETDVTARRGMADFSNREFFSIGKNFGQGDYDLPPNDIPSYTPVQHVVDSQGTKVDVLHHDVFDALANTTEPAVPLTTFGVWNDALNRKNNTESFTLIRKNYDAMADLLIPRAVAYSAGLIDYFFRGRLEIAPPDEGVYAILDHGVTNAANDGFTTLKLKLRNATPDIDDGQATHMQAMSGGSLWAVAKFRRNGCYQPDLSGQPGVTACDVVANHTDVEEIAVSEAVAVTTLGAAGLQNYSFDFINQPIPLDATDLYLQVVYRGALGSESDAVVVATRDLSEATYVTIGNYTDYYLLEGVFYTPQTILDRPDLFDLIDSNNDGQYDPAVDVDIDPVSLSYSFNFGGPEVGTVTLPPARIARLAILADNPTFRINLHKQSFGYWASPELETAVFHLNPATGEHNIKGFAQSRGTYLYKSFPDWKWLGNTSVGDINKMAGLTETTPYPINLNF